MYVKPQEMNAKSSMGGGHFLKRIGLAGFMFFFLKGLLWLLLPWLAHSAVF